MFGLGWHDTRCGSKPLWENLVGNMFRVLFQTQKTQSSEKNCLYVHFSQLVLKLSREFEGHHTLKKEIPQTYHTFALFDPLKWPWKLQGMKFDPTCFTTKLEMVAHHVAHLLLWFGRRGNSSSAPVKSS